LADVRLADDVATSDLPRTGRLAGRRPAAAKSAWTRNRDLLSEFVRRDLKARYRGSRLGILWSLFNPLVYMVIYSVVFSQFIRFPITGAAYPVYLLSGLLAWNFFSQALVGSVNSILGNSAVVKKVAFPWVLLPISSVVAALINYLISLVLLVPVLLFFHTGVGLPLATLPLLVLVTFLLAMGLGLLVAASNVYFRDVEYLLNIALQVGFFLTPIIYSYDLIADKLKGGPSLEVQAFYTVLQLNPMAWLATSFQDAIAFDRWPVHWQGLVYAAVISVVALAAGVLVFRRLQGRFAEEL
jgi:ABC-type polysaccharide/polyol phosphate export permease